MESSRLVVHLGQDEVAVEQDPQEKQYFQLQWLYVTAGCYRSETQSSIVPGIEINKEVLYLGINILC